MVQSLRLAHVKSSDASRYMLCLRYEDIRWLTSFTGSTSQLLLDTQEGVGHLFVDGRYYERAIKETGEWEGAIRVHLMTTSSSVEDQIADIVGEDSVSVDDSHSTAAHFSRLSQQLTISISPSSLDDARRVKDAEEISTITTAAAIADKAFEELLADGLFGKTERAIQQQLDWFMMRHGAHGVGFDTIVATGANGAEPHHEPSETVVEDGHLVVIDFGAELNGYRSDMTRTVQVGNVSAELLHMFAVVKEAQAAGVATIKAGVVGSQVDNAVREVFARHGVEHEYPHGTGHGIGLFIHEPPIFSPRCEARLRANEVVTVEPGLYRKGVGGVRIEDLVVVGNTGCHTLTNTPKDLLCPRSPRTI